jgi:hypothetical protein
LEVAVDTLVERMLKQQDKQVVASPLLLLMQKEG